MALQLTATKLPAARGLRRWMACATSSLPVPDSPVIKTVALTAATFAITRKTSWRAGLAPMISLKP
jgi:hypothetical protein